MQPDEDFAHRRGEFRVEREVGAAPVAARADRLELLEDRPAGFLHVGPDPLLEALAPQVEAGLSFLRHHALNHVLGCDPGVIGAGQPERVAPAHPLEAHQHVLHGVVQPVAHVQHRRHVGRRHHHDVAVTGIPRVGAEEVGCEPAAIEIGLDDGRVVLGGERIAHAEAVESSGELKSSSPCTRMQLMMLSRPGTARATRAAWEPSLRGHPAVQFHRARRHGQRIERQVRDGRVGLERLADKAGQLAGTRRCRAPALPDQSLDARGADLAHGFVHDQAGSEPEDGATNGPAHQTNQRSTPLHLRSLVQKGVVTR